MDWKGRIVRTVVLLGAAMCGLLVAGCQQRFAMDRDVFDRYYATNLRLSRSADVLTIIKKDAEVVTQTGGVVASAGERYKGQNLWFNAVAFDEQDLTAARKYAFAYEQFDKSWYVTARRRLRFDAQMLVGADVLAEPYTNDNARRKAILKGLVDAFQGDLGPAAADNQAINSGFGLVRQTLGVIMLKLDASPALAAQLDQPAGMEFDHPTIGRGHIRMVLEGDTLRLKIKAGQDWFNLTPFEKHHDVVNM